MDQTTDRTPPTWLELALLMVHGSGRLAGGDSPEPSVTGTIRSVEGSGGPQGTSWFGWSPSDVPAIAGQGPSGGREELRVWRDGARVRVEELDGSPCFVTDGTTTWTFAPGEPPSATRGRRVLFMGRGTQLLARPTARDVLEGDLSGPPGPVRATTRLGRAAWEVEVAPHEGGQHRAQVVVDATTGTVLERRVDTVGALDAWTELATGDEPDDALFTWTGPTGGRDVLMDSVVRFDAEREVERAAESRWWSDHVDQRQRSAGVEIELDLALDGIHERGRDGSFEASLGEELGPLSASLKRRPRSRGSWDLHWYGEPTPHRWSTQRWDWAFRLHEGVLTEAGYAAVERCFGDGRPGEG